jgi:4-amino-4-deoxy-L-arabinose transferase-like glycosyltransferase
VHVVEGRNAVQPSIAIPIVGAAVALLLHLAGNPHYGFIRDELYFIICGRHPQFGYVDQPPLIPLLAALTQIFGHSLFALRTISAICAAACVYVTCLLVREFDGGAFAEILAATAALLAPVLLAFGMVVAPDSINLWTWPLLMLFALRIAKGGDPRLWLAAGAVAGVAGK